MTVWDNAVFAGPGAPGYTISGDVDVRGAVHVVGDALNPLTISWANTHIRNTYADALAIWGAVDEEKLPTPPTVDFNGETVQTLDAELWLQNGTISLLGNSYVGQADVTGNGVKETFDATYIQGTLSVGGSASVNADSNDEYSVSVNIPMPSLNDPYTDPGTGITYATHRAYYGITFL